MSKTIRLGISTCPNDTFAFHALMHKLVDWRGLDYRVELLDIQQLNQGMLRREFDVAKASFHAALLLADQTCVLRSGSALGFGVGPLLLAAAPETVPFSAEQRTLCPGELTTAALLFNLFYPSTTLVEHVVFSEIMPHLQRGHADFGVCIHEGRFTWKSAGLHLVDDLGARWEREAQCPLPLGGILASRDLAPSTIELVQATIHESLQHALAHRQSPLVTMRHYAQELSDEVLYQHVDLYVNEWTVDLGEVGHRALRELSQRAAAAGIAASEVEIIADP